MWQCPAMSCHVMQCPAMLSVVFRHAMPCNVMQCCLWCFTVQCPAMPCNVMQCCLWCFTVSVMVIEWRREVGGYWGLGSSDVLGDEEYSVHAKSVSELVPSFLHVLLLCGYCVATVLLLCYYCVAVMRCGRATYVPRDSERWTRLPCTSGEDLMIPCQQSGRWSGLEGWYEMVCCPAETRTSCSWRHASEGNA